MIICWLISEFIRNLKIFACCPAYFRIIILSDMSAIFWPQTIALFLNSLAVCAMHHIHFMKGASRKKFENDNALLECVTISLIQRDVQFLWGTILPSSKKKESPSFSGREFSGGGYLCDVYPLPNSEFDENPSCTFFIMNQIGRSHFWKLSNLKAKGRKKIAHILHRLVFRIFVALRFMRAIGLNKFNVDVASNCIGKTGWDERKSVHLANCYVTHLHLFYNLTDCPTWIDWQFGSVERKCEHKDARIHNYVCKDAIRVW